MRFILLLILCQLSTSISAQDTLLKNGPMLGYNEIMEANVWLQTSEPAVVHLLYKMEKGDEWMATKNVRTYEEEFLTAKIKVTDLEPGTDYIYQIFINGEQVLKEDTLKFRTQAFWQFRTDPPPVSVMMGSCLFLNDPPFDRPGKGYGAEFEILDVMSNTEADIMLWLGDNFYYREPDFYSVSRLNYRNVVTRAHPELQPLFRNKINLATWDDHDYGPNNADRSYRMKEETLDLFKSYWLNPGYGTEATPGVFTRYKYHDIEFFLMDDRYHRAANRDQDVSKDYWGQEQLQWLKDALSSSNASFKFVVNGNQVINSYSGDEAYATFSEEYQDFYTWLEQNDVRGLVFLSGDRHHTELLKVERSGLYPLYEFTSSPITSGVHSNLRDETNNPLRVDGTLVNDRRNFGMLKVVGGYRDRTLTLQTIDSEGKLRWEYVIHQNDLRFPR